MRAASLGRICTCILLLAMISSRGRAQSSSSSADAAGGLPLPRGVTVPLVGLPQVNGAAADLWRLAQLRGAASTDGSLLRSPSTMMPPLTDSMVLSLRSPIRWALLLPTVQYTRNSAVPFSMNDGAMWAGKGSNVSIAGGFRLEWYRLQLALYPSFVHEENLSLPFYDNLQSGLPYLLPPYRSVWSTLWNIYPHGMDIPFRFGESAHAFGDPGESFASLSVGAVRLGVSTEHEWWGPGIENALMLSSNAAGVPRAFVRSAQPIETRLGSFEFSTFLGKLTESPYFRTSEALGDPQAFEHVGTTSRLLAAGALVWKPNWEPNLSLGLARSVFEERIYRGPVLLRWFDLFANTGQPNDRPATDTTARLGRDQLISLFGRWVFPADGFEVYAEWLRASMPVSLRDFLTDPSHSRGYTIGLQWLAPANSRGGALRIQGEATNLEQDASFRYRPIGSIYTSRVVPQGYTQLGQPLGAAIGPGSSSQFLGADYVAQRWSLGVFGERIRWNEDAHAQTPYPSFKGWCENDVSLLGGVRARWVNRLTAVTASFSTGTRYNAFFQMFAACPYDPATDPGRVVDVRNATLNLSFEPLVSRWR
jgi:hypothetical protein